MQVVKRWWGNEEEEEEDTGGGVGRVKMHPKHVLALEGYA